MLRNGRIIGPLQEPVSDYYFDSNMVWSANGLFPLDRDHDIIATISAATMNLASCQTAQDISDGAKDVCQQFFDLLSLAQAHQALIPLADAVLDHADANCRAFPIATAPRDEILVWDQDMREWYKAIWSETDNRFMISYHPDSYSKKVNLTHWAYIPPPPSNPPLPAVFVELGAALEQLKEGK